MRRPSTIESNRLPDPGAGFVWDTSGPAVLRPATSSARAAFTTRRGGSSSGPFGKLNIGLSVGDDVACVASNRRIAGAAVGAGEWWSPLRQVHGAEVVRARPSSETLDELEPSTPRPEADAVWTDDPAVPMAVVTADCVPVLLTGTAGVAVVHAGWRGLVAGVVQNAAEAIRAREAFAGPAIGPCCFRVGPDVHDALVSRFGESVASGPDHVDLWAAVEASGVPVVRSARICTSCHPDLFFSHRRDDGRTGRQGLVAVVA